MLLLLALLVIGGYLIYVLSPDERKALLQKGLTIAREAKDRADEIRLEPDPFRDGLKQRSPLVLVVPALIFINVTIYIFMVLGGAAFDTDSIIAWGGNIGMRTTNGEWWRLLMSIFLHAGLFHLIVSIAGMTQVGMLLERMLGHAAVAVVYVAAGLLASVQNISAQSVAVTYGDAGAIFGLYGVLLAVMMWSKLKRRAEPEALSLDSPSEPLEAPAPAALEIPLTALKRMAPAAGIFFLYTLVSGIGTAELSGLMAGFICGLVLASNASEEAAPLWRVGATATAAVLILVVGAYPLRGVSDVRPEIAKVVELEGRTAASYQKAVDQFKLGHISADALAREIDRSIVPELRAASARLKTLTKVPPEHQPLLASAEEYLRLRDESWRLRAQALHKSNLPALREADRTERASLEALEKLK
jgi:membrane associated rhomboid family serine protease